MITGKKTRLRAVSGITKEQENDILSFLQGAVYIWCKIKGTIPFSMHDLMGGDNCFWEGTPLFCLYEKEISNGKEENAALEVAGINAGWLLKKALANDKRFFLKFADTYTAQYLWDGNSLY